MRLDRFLKEVGAASRSEAKVLIKKGHVCVNDKIVLKDNFNVDEYNDVILIDGKRYIYKKNIYIMLNKPAGLITATQDKISRTVMDLITDYKHVDLFPVGRLDIDTTGLLLITNDGPLAHNLLSPKKHVDKTYYVECDKELTESDMICLEQGVMLDDGITLPAAIKKTACGYMLTIHEGRFHQVKRMFRAVNSTVTYLKRISFGPLVLDENLPFGSYRELTEEEIAKLK